jgi:hypothetical protein
VPETPARGTDPPPDVSCTAVAFAAVRHGAASTVRKGRPPQGANCVPLGGRFGKKKLKPGKYEATVVATDSAGQPSAPATARFRIVRR